MRTRGCEKNRGGLGMSILIVEDNATNALILKHLAKKVSDIEIVIEADPVKALERCHNSNFDMLILDHLLPGMSGIQLAKAVRMIDRYDGIPIIMVTADHAPELREEAARAGVNDFLTKPVEALAFRQLVMNHLAHAPSLKRAAV